MSVLLLLLIKLYLLQGKYFLGNHANLNKASNWQIVALSETLYL